MGMAMALRLRATAAMGMQHGVGHGGARPEHRQPREENDTCQESHLPAGVTGRNFCTRKVTSSSSYDKSTLRAFQSALLHLSLYVWGAVSERACVVFGGVGS